MGVAVEDLAILWEETLQPALETVYDWFNDNILPIIEEVAQFISDTFGPYVQSFVDGALNALIGGLNTLVGWLRSATTWFNNLAEAIRNRNSAASGTGTGTGGGYPGVAGGNSSGTGRDLDVAPGDITAPGNTFIVNNYISDRRAAASVLANLRSSDSARLNLSMSG